MTSWCLRISTHPWTRTSLLPRVYIFICVTKIIVCHVGWDEKDYWWYVCRRKSYNLFCVLEIWKSTRVPKSRDTCHRWINELTGAVKFAFLELALVCFLRLQNIELWKLNDNKLCNWNFSVNVTSSILNFRFGFYWKAYAVAEFEGAFTIHPVILGGAFEGRFWILILHDLIRHGEILVPPRSALLASTMIRNVSYF